MATPQELGYTNDPFTTTLTDDEIRQQIREIYFGLKHHYPTDLQLSDFVRHEIVPMIRLIQQQHSDRES